MSILFETTRRKPQRTTPTITAVLSLTAIALWLVVLPLELIA